MREQLASDRGERFTIFSNDFDPLLRSPHLTLGQAIRVLLAHSHTHLLFLRSDRGLSIVLDRENAPGNVTPRGGRAMLSNYSALRDTTAAKRALVLALIRAGWDGFRGLPDPEFRTHLLNLRSLVCMDLSVSASDYAKQAAKCWPRELEDLKTYGARMRANILRD